MRRGALHLVVSHRDSGETIHRGHEVALSLLPAAHEQMQRNRLPVMIDVPLGPEGQDPIDRVRGSLLDNGQTGRE